MTAQQSWVYQNDTDLLYANSNKPWVLGARYTYAAPIATTPQALLDQEALYSSHRAGFLFAWKFNAPPTAAGLEASDRHALIVLSQWYLSHAFRTGQSMNQAVPCVTVAYALNGRLGD